MRQCCQIPRYTNVGSGDSQHIIQLTLIRPWISTAENLDLYPIRKQTRPFIQVAMSHSTRTTSPSLPARITCYLGPPSAILLTSLASPQTALLSPLAFLPTACLFRTWRRSNTAYPSRRAELEPLIWTYAAAGTVGLIAVMLVQMAICSAASTILFIGSDDKTKDEFWTEFARSSIDSLSTDELARRADLKELTPCNESSLEQDKLCH